ncbi:Aminopeptidase S [Streptomyces sp. ADI96-02]|uniref:M20/M25/M40 family metallo-hydrolase n=1 Tax=Streptomyces sp. ADI96-02 TaxID=1522760 RepID=UPI000F5516E7|nr:M20/M25/M40 family metallo-hydrolase [Streptomyces sp. ADI96-02]RPK61883.1 Aminopeptidase S [Streptomyces sp. ADI96-02]
MHATRRRAVAVVAATALAAPLLLAASPHRDRPSGADPGREAASLSRHLVEAASALGAHRHLQRFQAIADSAEGHRAAGSAGHETSAEYVHGLLRKAGYAVSYQSFPFLYTQTLAEKLAVVAPNPREVAVKAMTYTPSTGDGGLTARLVEIPADGTTGCEAGDYASVNVTDRIALIKRGGCSFAEKQSAAATAGAAGAVIYNNTPGALSGTLGDAASGRIPTGGLSQADGEKLLGDLAERTTEAKAKGKGKGKDKGRTKGRAKAESEAEVTVSLDIRQLREERTTRNVVAETPDGDPARTVMLGAHLDSVTDGAGINDNGSGSAGLLEVALSLAESKTRPANKVRFAWWSAEENGLFGSKAYVAGLSASDREQLALYLNFDMIASPKGAQFVLDGDDSDRTGAGPGPEGSDRLESDIAAFLDRAGVPHEGADFTGRSDYGPFVEAGVPAGGTDTGAEGVKSAAQAERYGGEAGIAYDPCYHAACDDLDNIDTRRFETNIDVIAHAVGTYAQDLGSLPRPAASASGATAPSGTTAPSPAAPTSTSASPSAAEPGASAQPGGGSPRAGHGHRFAE